MPAAPLSATSLQLIDALRLGLAHCADVQERTLFGSYCFFVDGKLCMGVKGDEILARLPPEQHALFLETEGCRPLSPSGGMQGYFWLSRPAYAQRLQWQHWIALALAYNPRAKASAPKKRRAAPAPQSAPRPAAGAGPRRHPIFDEE